MTAFEIWLLCILYLGFGIFACSQFQDGIDSSETTEKEAGVMIAYIMLMWPIVFTIIPIFMALFGKGKDKSHDHPNR